MNAYGDYAAGIIHRQQATELREQARKDGLARRAKARGKAGRFGRRARAAAARPRTV